MQLSTLAELQWLIWPLLATFGMLGLIAVLSPKHFEKVAQRSSRWVDTNKLVETMDKTVYVDHHILRYARLFGCAVIAASAILAYFYYVIVQA